MKAKPRWWEVWIFTVWVRPPPLSHSWGSSSHWRQRTPAGRRARSAQPTASSPERRPPEASALHSFLVVTWDIRAFSFTSGSRKASNLLRAGRFTVEDLDQTNYNDEAQRHQLPHREDVLDPGGHADAGAVHPGQQHWAEHRTSLTTHSGGQRVLRTSLQYKGQTWHVSIKDQKLSADSEGGVFCWIIAESSPQKINA